MDWRDFDVAERNILSSAPAAHWRRFEVRLRLARERLEMGADISADLAALRREARFTPEDRAGESPLDS